MFSPSGGHRRLRSGGGTPPGVGTAGWLPLCGQGSLQGAGSEIWQDLAKVTVSTLGWPGEGLPAPKEFPPKG